MTRPTIATLVIALIVPASVQAEPKAAVSVLQTPDGVRFGMLGAKPARPAPILFIFAGSLEDSLGSDSYAACGKLLAKDGFVCVSLDLPCHGKERTEGDLPGLDGWRARLQKGEKLVPDFTARCSSVLDHLIKLGHADPQHICACGTSRGGFMALHFAAAEPRVKAVAAFAPVTNLLALREFAAMKDHAATKALELGNHADKLAGRRIWMCIGNQDERVSTDDVIACTRRLVAAAAGKSKVVPVELHVMPTAGHTIHATAHAEAAAWMLANVAGRRGQP